MAEQWERTMPCEDAHTRVRELRVYIADDNTIGLHTPPGDVAQFPPAAALEATHRGADWS